MKKVILDCSYPANILFIDTKTNHQVSISIDEKDQLIQWLKEWADAKVKDKEIVLIETKESVSQPNNHSEYQRCPVCDGRGLVPHGFYNVNYLPQDTTDLRADTCRTCNGMGII